MTDHWNRALRSALAPARELEPTDAEVQRVLAMDAARSKRRASPLRLRPVVVRPLIAFCSAIAIAGVAYAAPPTHAALDNVFDTLTAWVGGDNRSAPGRPLAHDDAPAWVRDSSGDKRLVAENGDAKLYAIRNGRQISFALGGSVGISDTIGGWQRQLAHHKVVVLGPGAFADGPLNQLGQRPLFGVTSRSVSQVELRYANGDPSIQGNLHGGFVLLVDAARQPRTLIAYDRAGDEAERVDVSGLQLRVCGDPRGCPPGALKPSVDGN